MTSMSLEAPGIVIVKTSNSAAPSNHNGANSASGFVNRYFICGGASSPPAASYQSPNLRLARTPAKAAIAPAKIKSQNSVNGVSSITRSSVSDSRTRDGHSTTCDGKDLIKANTESDFRDRNCCDSSFCLSDIVVSNALVASSIPSQRACCAIASSSAALTSRRWSIISWLASGSRSVSGTNRSSSRVRAALLSSAQALAVISISLTRERTLFRPSTSMSSVATSSEKSCNSTAASMSLNACSSCACAENERRSVRRAPVAPGGRNLEYRTASLIDTTREGAHAGPLRVQMLSDGS